MVYTSSKPHNAKAVCDLLLSENQRANLVALWGRDKLDLTPEQYSVKVQVYKKLNKVWNDPGVQASRVKIDSNGVGGKWDQTNTILVDDSYLKALAQPHNLIQVPEYSWMKYHGPKASSKLKQYDAQQAQIVESLMVKLEALKWEVDVSRMIYRWQTGKAEIPRVRLPGGEMKLVVDERIDQGQLGQNQDNARATATRDRPIMIEDDEDDADVEDGGCALGKMSLEDREDEVSSISDGSDKGGVLTKEVVGETAKPTATEDSSKTREGWGETRIDKKTGQ